MAKNSESKNLLNVEIVSPEGIIFEGEASSVTLPTVQGEITVLPHHVNLFTKLGRGIAIVTSGSKEQTFAIMGGFLEITSGTLRIISDFAISAEDISSAQAEEAKKRAERAKREADANVDFVEIEKDLQRSILQLDVAGKMKRKRSRVD